MAAADKSSFSTYTDNVSKRLSHSPYYSYFVKFNRILLPLIALGIIVTLFVWPLMNDNPVFRRKPMQQTQQNATNQIPTLTAEEKPVTMENPEFSGIDRQGRPFIITAQSVKQQDSTMTSDMDLTRPIADIFLKDQTWLALHALQGFYHQEKQHLDLAGKVTLFHDDGYSLESDKMFVDLNTGYAETDAPVHLQGPAGIIDADTGMELHNFGETVIFKGPAKLTLYGENE